MRAADDRWGPLFRYARPRRPLALAIGFAAVITTQVLVSGQLASLPSAEGSPIFPYQILPPVAMACLIVAGLSSPCRELEETAAGTALRHAENVQLAVATAIAATSLTVTADPGAAAILVRALLIWTGLALLSGRILGPTLAWVLPLSTTFPLIYFGWDTHTQSRWWNWLDQPTAHVPTWILAAISLAVGLLSRYATPWRLHDLHRRGPQA